MQLFTNNFRTTVAATFGITDTNLTVSGVEGLPDLGAGDFYLLTLFRLNGVEESGHEVIKVTSRAGLILGGITRSFEGAAASQFLAGDAVAARITKATLEGKADLGWTTTQLAGKEPTITAGTAGQYWRGDKSWQTLNKVAVGLSAVDNTADIDKPLSTAQAAADTTVLNSAKSYAEGLVVGLWDDRGTYDASTNVFPSTGGSGPSGAILKGDIWTISVPGSVGGVPVAARQTLRALIDSPAQVSSSWAIGLANTDVDDSITSGVVGRAPSQNAVYVALALKANANNATLTGTASAENLTFSGGSRRITGDFTNATLASQTLFQTSTVNGVTNLGLIPNGTSQQSQISAYNNSTPTDSSSVRMGTNASGAYLVADKHGTGSYLPLQFLAGGAERFRLSGTNNRFQADFSNATVANRLFFQSSVANGNSVVGAVPNGSSTTASYAVYNGTDPDNAALMSMNINNTEASFIAAKNGSGTTLPLTVKTNGVERLRFAATSYAAQIKTNDADLNNRFAFQDVTASVATSLDIIPGTSHNSAQVVNWNQSADRNNSAFMSIGVSNSQGYLSCSKTGTGTALPLIVSVNNIESFRVDTGGNFNFGTLNSGDPIGVRVNGTQFNQGTKAIYSRASSAWELGTTVTSATHISFYTDNGTTFVAAGTISSNGSTTSFNTSSDYRLKAKVKPMVNALDSMKEIQFKTWVWPDGRSGEGIVAHELQEISVPINDAVWGTKDAMKIGKEGVEVPDYQSVDYSKLVARIGCAVQELSVLLDAERARNDALEARLAMLEAKLGGV